MFSVFGIDHVTFAKADHKREAGEGVLATGATGAGLTARRQRGVVRTKLAQADELAGIARDRHRETQAALQQHVTGGGLTRTTPRIRQTAQLHASALGADAGSRHAAAGAFKAARRAKGATAVAVGLGAGAVALGSRKKRPALRPVGYS